MKQIRLFNFITPLAIITLFIASILVFAQIFRQDTPVSAAVKKSDWVAGNIISDATFTDNTSMTVAEIQSFLNKQIGTCDIQGASKATEYGSSLTRAQYAASRGWAGPPYVCLNKYYEVPKIKAGKGTPANNWNKTLAIPTGAKSAAWIIKDAANRYKINPKVILVKIATESVGPLTSDNWPLFSQYRYAMGSHCPDSGPGGSANCDTAYAGFSIQIYSAAELMRWYLDSMDEPWWSYKKPGVNNILWNVAPSGCGGANITIQNKATAALYTYTPYQPNAAALNNMYGTGNGCSAYGNRNFWRVYWDWFGNSRDIILQPMKIPRSMEVLDDTNKVSLRTMQSDGTLLKKGAIIAFNRSITVDGELYLQASSDTKTDSEYAVPFSSLRNIPNITYTTLPAALPLTAAAPLNKTSLHNLTDDGTTIQKSQRITFDSATTIDNILYYRTQNDSRSGIDYGIPASKLRTNFTIKSMKKPRKMILTTAQSKTSLHTTIQNGTKLSKNQIMSFNKQAVIGGVTYLITNHDAKNGNAFGVPIHSLKNVPTLTFSSMKYPRKLQASKNLQKTSLYTSERDGTNITKGQVMSFTSVVTIHGVRYLRTSHDTKLGNAYAIPYSDLRNI